MNILKESISTPITLGQFLDIVFNGTCRYMQIYTENDRDIICKDTIETYELYRGRFPNANEILNSKVSWINVVQMDEFDNNAGLVIVIDYKIR